jgi:hypothetical protein
MEFNIKAYVPRSGKFQSGRERGRAEPAFLEVNPKHQPCLVALKIDEVEIGT